MARMTPQTLKLLARDLYEYQLSDEAAATIAHMLGAMATYSGRLETLGLAGLQPPFGYPTLQAEAERRRHNR